jgi:hypothetical protein
MQNMKYPLKQASNTSYFIGYQQNGGRKQILVMYQVESFV